jgi:hypothetical protein
VLEIAFALGLLSLLAAFTVLKFLLAVETVLLLGVGLVAGGLVLGVPTGAIYHVALRASLARAGALPARWWLQPTSLHDRIPPDERAWVLGWCYAGAAGFLITMAGCVVVAVGAWRAAT